MPGRYTVDDLKAMKRAHEMWVAGRLHAKSADDESTLAVLITAGKELWPLMRGVFGWSIGMPDDLSDEEEDIVDSVLQTITDWCDISINVEGQGLRAVREAKRSLTAEVEELRATGLVLLCGLRAGSWAGGEVVGPILVLEVVRPSELEDLRYRS